MKYLLSALFVCFAATLSFGQLEKIFHQIFEVNEVQQINLDLYGDYEIAHWAAENIMAETRIELYNASASILNHFMEKERRYHIESESDDQTLLLRSHDKKRNAIKTKSGECHEIVILKIFVPEKFSIENKKVLTRLN